MITFAGLAAGCAALFTLGVAAPAEGQGPALTGVTWQWQETLMSDGARIVAPAPQRYTVTFRPEGNVDVLADCNRGGGRYATVAPGRIAVGPVATTKKLCPQGTQDAVFLRGLANVERYLFDGSDLVLMLKVDSGTMRFRPAPG